VLLARRPLDKKHGGLWEFPGGKFESGENLQQALYREIYEELGLEVLEHRVFIDIQHDYPDYSVLLRVALVTDFRGKAAGKEGQQIAWVSLQELANYEFPEANEPILQKLSNLDRQLS
jgi:8-oxo-dGTP diphosphatase